MPEAPPNRPGHAGYTPQDVQGGLIRARLEGIETANVPRLFERFAGEFASQEFPQLERFGKGSAIEAMARAELYQRKMRELGAHAVPRPETAFGEGFNPQYTRRPADQ